MKTRNLLGAMILCATLGHAADPDPGVGTWKLNPSKSKFPPGIPAEVVNEFNQPTVMVITKQNDLVDVRVTRGSEKIHYTVPKSGGPPTFLEGYQPEPGISYLMTFSPDRRTAAMVGTKDGKVAANNRSVVSAYGKSMVSTATFTLPDGKSATVVTVSERQ
jgi:hypothetical protein